MFCNPIFVPDSRRHAGAFRAFGAAQDRVNQALVNCNLGKLMRIGCSAVLLYREHGTGLCFLTIFDHVSRILQPIFPFGVLGWARHSVKFAVCVGFARTGVGHITGRAPAPHRRPHLPCMTRSTRGTITGYGPYYYYSSCSNLSLFFIFLMLAIRMPASRLDVVRQPADQARELSPRPRGPGLSCGGAGTRGSRRAPADLRRGQSRARR